MPAKRKKRRKTAAPGAELLPYQKDWVNDPGNLVTAVTNYAGTLVNNMLFVTPYSIQNANASTNAIALGNLTVSFGNIVPGGYP